MWVYSWQDFPEPVCVAAAERRYFCTRCDTLAARVATISSAVGCADRELARKSLRSENANRERLRPTGSEKTGPVFCNRYPCSSRLSGSSVVFGVCVTAFFTRWGSAFFAPSLITPAHLHIPSLVYVEGEPLSRLPCALYPSSQAGAPLCYSRIRSPVPLLVRPLPLSRK